MILNSWPNDLEFLSTSWPQDHDYSHPVRCRIRRAPRPRYRSRQSRQALSCGGNRQLTLSWDDPNDPSITRYQYAWVRGMIVGAWTDIPDSAPGEANATSYTVGPLLNGYQYTAVIRAVNAVGDSPASDSVTATPVYPPGGPTGLRATPGDGQATLTWHDPYDGSITKYRYRQFVVSGGGWGAWMDIPDSAPGEANATSYTVTGLTNGVRHVFAVRAVNVCGHSTSSLAITTPAASQGAKGSFGTSAATHPAPTHGAHRYAGRRQDDAEVGRSWRRVHHEVPVQRAVR